MRMAGRTGGLPIALWGVGLLLITALGVAVFDLGTLPAGLLAGAGLWALATGVTSDVVGRRRGGAAPDGAAGAEVVPRSSLPAVAVACGATVALVGSVVGQALLWPGIGIVVLGVAGLLREQRAARRLLRHGAAPR
ncbi:MAG: hypothetical protein QOK49_2808 [Baekduia sp.]|nr:hypothetical protein [Baekduia sp.]